MLYIKKLSISFSRKIIEDGNLRCRNGEIISISGKSGSGKTTLLRYIIGEIKPESGKMFFDDIEITDENRDGFLFNYITYIDQMGNYYPNMTIRQHFEFYAKVHELDINDDIIEECLRKVRLDNISLKKYPVKLSTGERKRFLIAIALMVKKKIIIMDEPTASLDNANIDILSDIIVSLSEEDISFIISTHNKKIIDIAHTSYTIESTQLIESIQKEIKKTEYKIIDKKPGKIKYTRYKNLRQKILFGVIVVLTALSLSFVSWNITSTFVFNNSQNLKSEKYKNNVLYFVKSSDEKLALDNHDTLCKVNFGIFDAVGANDIEKIKSIEGVIDVKATVYVEKMFQKESISVYKHGNPLKEVDTISSVNSHESFSRDVIITGYYPEDKIKKDGKLIDGVYINEVLEDILDLDSYEDIEILFYGCFFKPLDYRYNEAYESMYLEEEVIKDDVKISIDGVLTSDEYDDGRNIGIFGGGRIYMPIDMLKSIVDAMLVNNGEEAGTYQSGQQTIFVEEGYDEEVKLQIEEMDDRYYVRSKQLTDKDLLDHLSDQSNSSFIITSVTSLSLLMAVILFVIYYVYQLNKEIVLLNRDGLKHQITSYYRRDDIVLLISWMILSALIMILYYFIDPIKHIVSTPMFYVIWGVILFILYMIVLIVKTYVLKRNIKRINV